MSTITDTRPEVEFDQNAYPDLFDAYRHEDGSITYIVFDTDPACESPREHDGNIATLIQRNSDCISIDDDDADLTRAWDHFYGYGLHGTTAPKYGIGQKSSRDREDMMARYLAIFRPDILHFAEWSAGESYGWGYVMKSTWDKHMYRQPPEDATQEEILAWVEEEPSCTPEEAFDAEVKLYGQWADGEVYGAHHVSIGKPIVVYGEQGAYVDGYDTEEESCWGFLGYDDRKDIAKDMTSSPITEVLY